MKFLDSLSADDLVLDALPDDVAASMEVRKASLERLSAGGALGLEFIVTDLRSWRPRNVVTVAFLDGDPDLHRDIATVATAIGEACALSLDFGEMADGTFRRWTENDTTYAADVRMSFDKKGYFSLIGIDSIDKGVGSPLGEVGGRPHQASLNLGGFAISRPPTWRGTVLHEFLHALGFHHSHQNMRGPCQAAFRWEDDEGYTPTQDARGAFIIDHNGKRPGIYAYLAGFPNFWNRAKVDHNLKTEEDPNVLAGPFDAASVMLYRFPPLFYRTLPSPCAPTTDGQVLSDGDKRGLQLLYPGDAATRAETVNAHEQALAILENEVGDVAAGLENAGTGPSHSVVRSLTEAMRRKLEN
jgi:hypothetical protein